MVQDRWHGVDWGTVLASGHNIIYALVDGRGSGFRGNNLKFQLHRALGGAEVADQIAVARDLANTYAYIDKSRVGIWGWSYGGYVSAAALAKDTEDVFKCGVAVAPVTDWFYYDSIYTERYMSTPEDNLVGYQNASVTRNVANFAKKRLYLIHGNADDNVHYQQSMVLAKVLETADIQFTQTSYPDENHSLDHVKPHLYHSMLAFWKNCFDLE